MTSKRVRLQPSGVDILHNPELNKGTAFTKAERKALGLTGLLPPRVCSMEIQELRVLDNYKHKTSNLEKYIFLTALQDRNEVLFFRVLLNNIVEMMPIVYTPVVGQACREFGHIWRRPKGLFVSLEERGHIAETLENWPTKNVDIIVVTDGERILGLGDLGANGMGIPIGKLALYSACAGVDPRNCLPITLDVGTNNNDLLKDDLYIGLPHRRITGEEYDAFIDEFVHACREVFPNAVIQFEDFGNHNAFRILRKYRDKFCCFNDDIQGTAGVTLAGLLSALRITGKPLTEQKIVFFGAGEANVGIGDLIVSSMVKEGLSHSEAMARCWFVDSKGLVVKSREDLQEHKKPYAHDFEFLTDLPSIVERIQPTALIGASGQSGAFTEEIVRTMTRLNPRPIIFALSNPTSKAECTAENAYRWSDGRVVFATGSPFDPVTFGGKTYITGQSNNAYVFPGIGLGAILCRAHRITDEMFFEAAKTLADIVTEKDLESGCIFPPLTKIREVSAHIAAAVIRVALRNGLTDLPEPEDILSFVTSRQYQPVYEDYLSD